MNLTDLAIYHYRNLQEISLSFDKTINCFVGNNGVGKTNILDAIYYLSFCKSNLFVNDSMNVMHDEHSFMLKGGYDIHSVHYNISCSYTLEDKTKIFKCNDKKYSRLADHIGLLPLVFISPSDMFLITESGSERRKFLDSFISMYDTVYLKNLIAYNKLLQQRNSVLKQEYSIDETYLSILDEKLSVLGTALHAVRNDAIKSLSIEMSRYYSIISSREECSIVYESQLNNCDMHTLLKRSREKDRILTYTSSGVHRDDLQFLFNETSIKTSASQGQKKSFLLALRFAQYHLIRKYKNGDKPLLLLDDLFDKLDKERSMNIFDLMERQEFGQVFITDTDSDLLHVILEQKHLKGNFYTVENGVII